MPAIEGPTSLHAHDNNATFISVPYLQEEADTDWSSYTASIVCSAKNLDFDATLSTTSSIVFTGADVENITEGDSVIFKLPGDNSVHRGVLGAVQLNTSGDPSNYSATAGVTGITLSSLPEKILEDKLPSISISAGQTPGELRAQDTTVTDLPLISNKFVLIDSDSGVTSKQIKYGNKVTPWEELTPPSIDTIEYVSTTVVSSEWLTGLCVSNDGTNVYTISDNGIEQCTLATPFDMSTCSTPVHAYSFTHDSAEHSAGIAINNNGTKIITFDAYEGSAYRAIVAKLNLFTLTTAWDLSTASLDAVSGDISDIITDGVGLSVSKDNANLYVINQKNKNEAVHQYSIDSNWDLSSIAHVGELQIDTDTFGDPWGVTINSTGSRLFVANSSGAVYQFLLRDYGSVSTAEHEKLDAGGNQSYPNGLTLSADGYHLYSSGRHSIDQSTAPASLNGDITLAKREETIVTKSNSINITNAVNSVTSIETGQDSSNPQGVWFTNTGTILIVADQTSSNNVHQYALSEPYDISTAVHTGSIDVRNYETNLKKVILTKDGTEMFVTGVNSKTIRGYSLTVPFDVTSASWANYRGITSDIYQPWDMHISHDDLRLYILDGGYATKIAEYRRSEPGTTYSHETTYTLNDFSYSRGMAFADDGLTLLLLSEEGILHQFILQIPYDLSAVTHISSNNDISNITTDCSGLSLNTAEDTLFFIHEGTKSIYQCNIGKSSASIINIKDVRFAPRRIDIEGNSAALTVISETWTDEEITRYYSTEYTPTGARAIQYRIDGNQGAKVSAVHIDLTKHQ